MSILPFSNLSLTNLSLDQIKRQIMDKFQEAGLDTPDIDARLLIMAVTGMTRADLITQGETILSGPHRERLSRLVTRRLSGEPIDHILGARAFYGRDFKISKAVLSPRPETELLVDFALTATDSLQTSRLLDLGTGSGAIIISILAERETTRGVGVDLSGAALSLARENAHAHGVETRCDFRRGSWFTPLADTDCFDGIVANPPYISDLDMGGLDRSVKDFDPDLALRGGPDGLEAYRDIIARAGCYLKPGGWIALEIGYDQSEAVSACLKAAGFHDIHMTRDLAGHPRMISGLWPNTEKDIINYDS